MTSRKQVATRVWHRAFLSVLAQTGNVTLAATQAGVGRATAYEARNRDLDFSDAWDEAIETACDLLEAEAWRRGVEGWEEPVYGRVGQHVDGQIGVIRRYDPRLLTLLLKAHRPEKYAEKPRELESFTTAEIKAYADRLKAQIEARGGEVPTLPPSRPELEP